MVSYVESTVSLGIQIAVLVLLIVAVFVKSRKKYWQHGMIMLSALVLHLISIVVVMGPSFGAYVSPGPVDVADVWTIVTFVHVSTGLVAALLGAWLVGSWHAKVDLGGCFKKKRIMDITLILWILAIVLGISLYLVIVGFHV